MRALFYTVVARLRDFLRPAAGDADFDQELEAHLAMAEEDKVRRGMSPERGAPGGAAGPGWSGAAARSGPCGAGPAVARNVLAGRQARSAHAAPIRGG